MYALIEFEGKQYRAEEGKTLKVDAIDAEAGAALTLDKVLLVGGETPVVGTPYIAGVTVSATVGEHGKDRKITVFKYIPKKDYRRKQGHRQRYSTLKIEKINAA